MHDKWLFLQEGQSPMQLALPQEQQSMQE